MITSILITLFEKELDKLKEELAAYEQDDQVWKTAEGISNSGGNLCLHLTGNLQHFIGATLAETGYIRNREAEFKLKNIPRHKLLEEVDNARQVVTDTLEQLSKKELETEYPIQVTDEPMSTQAFLIYLLKHLSYHIGQINYHRRLVK
jgi:uncharacterized damage-inducible protein DinB